MSETIFKAGYAEKNVTPPLGVKIPGQQKVRIAEGIITPLMIRAVAFDDGIKRGIIFMCDAVGISNKAYEDDKVLAFYDLEPQAPVHILIIPKEHIVSAMDITSENSAVIAHIFEVAAIIAKELKLENGSESLITAEKTADRLLNIFISTCLQEEA